MSLSSALLVGLVSILARAVPSLLGRVFDPVFMLSFYLGHRFHHKVTKTLPRNTERALWGEYPTSNRVCEYYISIMNLLVILIVLMLLFGGGGFYLGGPMVGGGGFGLILLILLVLFFTGRLSRR